MKSTVSFEIDLAVAESAKVPTVPSPLAEAKAFGDALAAQKHMTRHVDQMRDAAGLAKAFQPLKALRPFKK
ncbi:hypothetical protein [Polyangium jinanense]|uniref:Uncharacterized protein n=1 Tax=Polyangium jinanense TaxID=2829994 RepID=A0A9X3XH09_9BACT|nr:hypothetical protein [Polyangium jinanense]MDC3962650.1 hypothetical protein [Polyangium jinanense]MDC3989370.1 hypothetical protein [Polyangium jinanense]